MVFELERSQFGRCENVVNPRGQLEVKAIIEGINPGRVFVDNKNRPSSGLVWLGNHDGFFFFGDEKNGQFIKKIPIFIDRVIAPQAREFGLQWFECFGNHRGWEKAIENIFAQKELKCWNQKVFTMSERGGNVLRDVFLPREFSLFRLSRENFSQEISNFLFWAKRICQFWDDPISFFEKGIGYGILKDKEIVGLCFSGFVSGSTHGIDIETLPDFQGKKLAQIMAGEFLKECNIRNFRPYWDCMESNRPSEAVARKIGLVEAFTYKGYEFSL